MSFYFDYFRAPDARKAKAIAAAGFGKKAKNVDVLSLRNMDAEVRIGLLLSFVKGVSWTVDTVSLTYVWPPEPSPKTPEDFDQIPENSPWWTSDYHLLEFTTDCRDQLASLEDSQVGRLNIDWVPPQEFENYDLEGLHADFQALVDLAKRAQSAHDKLYVCRPPG